jgi:hypothetical protein
MAQTTSEEMMTRHRQKKSQTFAIHVAVMMLAGVSFVTTVAGVLSLMPPEESTEAALWWFLAVLLAGGLAVGIGAISMMLFERVTVPRLAIAVILATIATIFDASFWQRQYLRVVTDVTGDRVDEEARRREYDRLTGEATVLIGRIRIALDERHLAAVQGEGQALDRRRYEEELRPEDNLRYCGRQCLAAQEAATRYHAEVEQAERQKRILNRVAATPASDRWDDLDRFQANLATLIRDIPTDVSLPAAPARPRLLTDGGNAVGVGGLGVLMEMLLAGEFNHRLVLPLCLAAISEYTVVLLVLGARPWRPCRLWLQEKVENVEDSFDRLTKDARAGRRERNRRRQQQEMLEREFDEFRDQVSLRARATYAWRENRPAPANGNGHDTQTGTTEHGDEQQQRAEGGRA